MGHPRKYAIQDFGTGWRERLAESKAAFTQRNLDEVHQDIEDKVYAMALDGCGLKTIADYFGVPREEFAIMYREVWVAGRAELEAMVMADQVDYGLNSRIPVAKIWLGKSIAGLGEGKSVDVVNESDDGNDLNIKIKVIRREEGSEE